jgi:hypothetical protein
MSFGLGKATTEPSGTPETTHSVAAAAAMCCSVVLAWISCPEEAATTFYWADPDRVYRSRRC